MGAVHGNSGCMQTAAEGSLMLVSLGAAGKVLTVDLHRLGYRVIDVGSLDMEYGWFCEGAAEKMQGYKARNPYQRGK